MKKQIIKNLLCLLVSWILWSVIVSLLTVYPLNLIVVAVAAFAAGIVVCLKAVQKLNYQEAVYEY